MSPHQDRTAAQARADLQAAMRVSLGEALQWAEKRWLSNAEPVAAPVLADACCAMFESRTQAYREVALGCLLTRLHEPDKDIRRPYVRQGDRAFNGRALDEAVVNPFLREHSIPCSTGPYLNVFRRQVTFDESTRARVRDKRGFDGLLTLVSLAEQQEDPDVLRAWLGILLWHFVRLREQSSVELMRLERVSLPQYDRVVEGLLERPSGGFLALALVVATVHAPKETLGLDWQVEHQGISVPDAPSKAGGDITVRRGGETIMVLEVTERPVDRARLVETFRTKIAAQAEPSDYVFMVRLQGIEAEVAEQAARYFAQGYDVNFVDIAAWVRNTLASIGKRGRQAFQDRMIGLLSSPGVPKLTKLVWNEELQRAI